MENVGAEERTCITQTSSNPTAVKGSQQSMRKMAECDKTGCLVWLVGKPAAGQHSKKDHWRIPF